MIFILTMMTKAMNMKNGRPEMTKSNTSRFWQRWLKGETRESLIEWLESQGAYVGIDEAEYKKYSLKELQYLKCLSKLL